MDSKIGLKLQSFNDDPRRTRDLEDIIRLIKGNRDKLDMAAGPLAELLLDTLRHVPAGTFFSIGEVEELQAQCSARLSLGERLLRLNELMLRAEQLPVEA